MASKSRVIKMAILQIDLHEFLILWSDLVLWRGRTSPSVWAWSSVFYASCPRSAAGPWAGCWRTPGRWSRNGPGCCCCCCCRPLPTQHSNPLWVFSSAELLVLFGRLLLKRRYNKNNQIKIMGGQKLEVVDIILYTWGLEADRL